VTFRSTFLHGPTISNCLKGVSLLTILATPQCAFTQQISGRFYPEKQHNLVGEPVIVDFEIENWSQEDFYFTSFACPQLSSIMFQVENAPPKHETKPYSCVPRGEIIDCLGGYNRVPANGKYRKRLLLDGNFELKSPGSYHVRATRAESCAATQALPGTPSSLPSKSSAQFPR
jgi:hypothetical protein